MKTKNREKKHILRDDSSQNVYFHDIDWAIAEQLCRLHCTKREIYSVLDRPEFFFEKMVPKKFNMKWVDYYDMHTAHAKVRLRKIQFNLAERSAAMAIWLGKHILNQKEDTNTSSNLPDIHSELLQLRQAPRPIERNEDRSSEIMEIHSKNSETETNIF